jgi:lysophospholipase L1-like esterase
MVLMLLILVEGVFSYTHFLHTIVSKAGYESRSPYIRYDEDYGWVNRENAKVPEAYRLDRAVRINSQDYRADRDYGTKLQPGKVRIIANGDSFTFGHGVDQSYSWPALLEAMDGSLEVINAAVSGYSVGQSYLHCYRDCSGFERDVYILAFVFNDVVRMRGPTINGYGKPLLELDNNKLIATNVPVPKHGVFSIWLAQNKSLLKELRTIQVLGQIYGKIRGKKIQSDHIGKTELKRISRELLKSLNKTEMDRDSRLLVVFLPTKEDQARREIVNTWRSYMRDETRSQGIDYIDLIDRFQLLTSNEIDALFSDSDGFHYGKEGNAWVAKAIYKWLMDEQLLTQRQTVEQ